MSREMTMTSQSSRTARRIDHRSAASVLLAAVTAVATTVGLSGPANATGSQSQVTYQLTGSAPVAEYVSYQADSGQTQQAHVPLPWKTQFNVNGNRVLVISAQSPGSITCTILVDGNVVSQATANGAPARTVCSH
jgi:Mycobacterium membrane protein